MTGMGKRCRMIHMKVALAFLAAALTMVGLSCRTPGSVVSSTEAPLGPSPVPAGSSPVGAHPTPSPSSDVAFDPSTVSAEEKQEAMMDISELIQMLNAITQRKDFKTWKSYCTDGFISKYSSPETLVQISSAPILMRLGIVLHSLEDYFNFVVYPSHQNDRVDDIEFIGHNRVRAITISKKGERLVLWDLEKIDSSWKIGTGR